MTCLHESFAADVAVHRMPKEEGGPILNYSAEVRIRCAQCGQAFRFIGAPLGLSFKRPMMSPNGEELRCPIEPSDDSLQGERMTVEMPEGAGNLQ